MQPLFLTMEILVWSSSCPQVGVSVGGRAEVKRQQGVLVSRGLVFLSDSPPPLHPLPRRHTAGGVQWSSESSPFAAVYSG